MSAVSGWQRHFLAVRPDAAARAALGALTVDPAARRTPSDDLHATLAFLGTLDEDGERRALGALAAAADANPRPLEIALDRVERWPTAWVACDDPRTGAPELHAFVARLRQQLDRVGFVLEARPFRAHVTLARQPKGRTGPAVRLPAPVRWASGEALLMASRGPVAPGEPRYGIRARVALG